MSLASFGFDALRVATLLAMVLGIVVTLRRAAAATRRNLVVAAVVGALATPIAARALSAVRATAVIDWPSLALVPAVEPAGVAAGAPEVTIAGHEAEASVAAAAVATQASTRIDGKAAVLAVWALGVALV